MRSTLAFRKEHVSNPLLDEVKTFLKELWCRALFPCNIPSTCQSQSLFFLLTFVSDIAWLIGPLCRVFHVAGSTPPPPHGVLMSYEFKLERLFSPSRRAARTWGPSPRWPITEQGNKEPRSPYSTDWHSLPLICQQIRMDGVGAILSWRCRTQRRGCRAASPARYHWQVVWSWEICESFAFVISRSFVRDSVLFPVIAYLGRLGLLLAFICGLHGTYIRKSGAVSYTKLIQTKLSFQKVTHKIVEDLSLLFGSPVLMSTLFKTFQ